MLGFLGLVEGLGLCRATVEGFGLGIVGDVILVLSLAVEREF